MSVSLDDRRDVAAIHPLRFWTDYTDAGDGSMVPAEWVEWVKKGDAHGATTAEKVSRAQKMPVIWDALRPHYDAWKRGQDVVTDGTPLDAVAFATRELCQALARVHIRSVEDLVGAEDAALTRLNIPGIRGIQAKARAFLEAQRNTAGVASALAERDERLAAQKAELDELRRTVEELASAAGKRQRTRAEVMAQPAEA
jgi:hypothetical protein